MITRVEKHAEKSNIMPSWLQQFSTKSRVIISVHILILVVILLIDSLDYQSKISLFAFLSAMTLWITTKIPAGFVAIALIVFIIIMNAGDPELLYHSLSEEVVWLMVGSFIIGEAVKQSGLAERLSLSILRNSNKKRQCAPRDLFGLIYNRLFHTVYLRTCRVIHANHQSVKSKIFG